MESKATAIADGLISSVSVVIEATGTDGAFSRCRLINFNASVGRRDICTGRCRGPTKNASETDIPNENNKGKSERIIIVASRFM
mmetsp:Transcript_12055/g.28453  ORF Transcript_12055/g.28453 Transcript_12055/m.28453 type:complete len:84 (+) Transcript_12055:776-1027(+)